jgi:hypothetical protein
MRALVALAIALFVTNGPVDEIRARVAAIDQRVPRDAKVEWTIEGEPSEGGHLVAYFADSSLDKIDARFHGAITRWRVQRWFDVGKLIYVDEIVEHLDPHVRRRTASRAENRFWFRNDTLVRWTDARGRAQLVTSDSAADRATELLESAREDADSARVVRSRR